MSELYNGLKVLAVSMRKGGVGKTLFSILIAQYLADISKRDLRVLLIDLDSQQNSSSSLLDMDMDDASPAHMLVPVHPDYDPEDPDFKNWDGKSSSADIFTSDPELDPDHYFIAPYPTQFERLDVLPAAGRELLAVELVRDEDIKEHVHERLRRFFEDPDVQEEYDVVVIDTSPGEGPINRSVLRAATHVIYPVVPEQRPIEGLRAMLLFERIERNFRDVPIEVVGVVPNQVKFQTRLHRENLKLLRNDPVVSPLLTDFHIGNRTAFPSFDKPGIKPNNIWEFTQYPEAREEALKLGRFVESRLFGEK